MMLNVAGCVKTRDPYEAQLILAPGFVKLSGLATVASTRITAEPAKGRHDSPGLAVGNPIQPLRATRTVREILQDFESVVLKSRSVGYVCHFPYPDEVSFLQELIGREGSLRCVVPQESLNLSNNGPLSRYMRSLPPTSFTAFSIANCGLQDLELDNLLVNYHLKRSFFNPSFTTSTSHCIAESIKEGGRVVLIGTATDPQSDPLAKALLSLGLSELRPPEYTANEVWVQILERASKNP